MKQNTTSLSLSYVRNFKPIAYLCSDFAGMKKVSKKTLEYIEFPQVVALVAERCATDPGRENARKIHPFLEEELLRASLGRTQEYLDSFQNENRIPNHGFEAVDPDLKVLRLENSLLTVAAFRKFALLSNLIKSHQQFFEKF